MRQKSVHPESPSERIVKNIGNAGALETEVYFFPVSAVIQMRQNSLNRVGVNSV